MDDARLKFIQSFTNSLNPAIGVPMQVLPKIAKTAQKNNWNTRDFIGNAARNTGQVASGIGTLINPLDKNNPLNVAATNPDQLPSYAGEFVKSVGQGLNNQLGQPVNPQTMRPQIPSIEKAAQYSYDNPAEAALNAATLTSGAGMLSKGASKGNALTKAGQSLQGNKIPVKPEARLSGASRQANVQNVIDEIPGKNATEKFANQQGYVSGLSDQISDIVTKRPTHIPYQSVENAVMNRSKDFISQGKLTREVAADRAKFVIDDLYQDLARQRGQTLPKDTIPGNFPGSTVDMADLLAIKPRLGKLAQDAFKADDLGKVLTPEQQIHMAAWEAVDDLVKQYYPEVKDLSVKQSYFMGNKPPASKAIVDAMNNPVDKSFKIVGDVKIPNMVAKPAYDAAGRVLETAGNTPPLAAAGLAQTGNALAGLGVVEPVQDKQDNQYPYDQSNHMSDSISQNGGFVNIKPDQTGHFQLSFQSQPSGQYMTEQDFIGRTAGLSPTDHE
jgi:hypothetical protein